MSYQSPSCLPSLLFVSGGYNESTLLRHILPVPAMPAYTLETVLGQSGQSSFPVPGEEYRASTAPPSSLVLLYHLPPSSYSGGYHCPSSPHHISADAFLRPERPLSRFVGDAADIRQYIEETFLATTGKPLPYNLCIRIASRDECREQHEALGGQWSEGIQGFSINRHGIAQSVIVIRENDLDKVLITVGHELGHVLTPTLAVPQDEEAKAFAFEMAWVKTLYENNIAGMQQSISLQPQPAHNGLHDTAFHFVREQLRRGKEPLLLVRELVTGKEGVNHHGELL